MSDLYSPLMLFLAFRALAVLIQTVGQVVVVCLALRGAAPEHRAPILRALGGKTSDDTRQKRRSRSPTALSQTDES